jgi:hypothetical protein
MRHNSGIIGAKQPVNYQSATGIHDTTDVLIALKQTRWPFAKTYVSTSLSSNVDYNEGSSFSVTINVTGFLNGELIYYTIDAVSGTVNTSDFTDGVVSGSLTVNNGTCTLSKTLVFDGTSEAGDSFKINIRDGSTSGPIKLSTGTISILNPSFTVNPGASSVNEGSSVTWTTTTTNVNNGTTLYYTLSGVEAADVAATSGSFTISSNTGSFTTTTIADALTEGAQTITAQIRTGSTGGTIVATNTCIINDTSLNPTISASATTIDEGGTVTFTVSTTGLANGTTLYWSTNGVTGTVATTDFTDSLLTGSFTVTSNTGTITRTLTSDFTTEGSESFTLSIRTGSISGTVVATTPTITVNDTSQLPSATITPNVTSLNEGATVTFTVNTTNFTNGTLYWTTSAVTGTILPTDFSDNSLSGTVTIAGSTGTISRAVSSDTKDEGTESFTISVRYGSVTGSVIATSSTITINDTSTGGGYELIQYMTPSDTPVTYTVPSGITSLTVNMWGGNGGSSNPQLYRLNIANTPNPGGAGAYLSGTMSVTAGDTILVYVGGAGGDAVNGTTPGTAGINGGMAGARGSYQGSAPGSYGSGGGGGGYTGIKKNGTWFAIAGGGGGGGHGDGYGNRGYGVGDGGAAGIGSTSGAGVAGSVPSGNRGGVTYSNGGGSGGTVGSVPSTGSVALGSTNSLSTYDSGGGGGGGGGANGGNGSQGADAGHPCPGGGGGASMIPSGWSSSYARTYSGAPTANGGVIITPT